MQGLVVGGVVERGPSRWGGVWWRSAGPGRWGGVGCRGAGPGR